MKRGPARIMLTTDTVGGVWRYCLTLAAGLARHGVCVLMVTVGPAPSSAQRAEAASITGCELRVTDLPLDWTADCATTVRRAADALVAIATGWGADTLQLHTPALVPTGARDVPVIAVAHSCVGTWWRAVHGGELPDDLAWRATLAAEGLVAADVVLAPSRSFAASLIETYRLARPIEIVPNGLPVVTMQRTPRPHAFVAGRLWDEGKNIAALDEASALSGVRVLAAGPIAGPNGDVCTFRHLRLLGTLGPTALARQYARAAVFVSPALYEPFGLAALEAAQAGCSLLLSGIASLRELWGGAALFVDPGDTQGLAAALRSLIDAPAECARMGAAAAERAARFSAAAMVERTWDIHRALISGRALAPAA